MGPARLVLALIALVALYSVASAARTQQEQQLAIRADRGESVNHLNTYYFDASKPQVALSSRGSARAGRTALTVTLPGSSSVSTFMPVVSPKADGMKHSVSKTWSALKNLATMFASVNTINRQNNPSAPRLFPRAFVAVTAASDNGPAHMDVAKAITVAEASGQRSNWANARPSSVLLLPFGQSTGAVADVMDVTYDPKADAVTLELDIVHDPHTISEFQPHAKQTLQVDEAHYHFDTAPGVKVDAQALLDNLKVSNFALEGVHLFIKGDISDSGCDSGGCDGGGGECPLPCIPSCFSSTLTTNLTSASEGDEVVVTFTITALVALNGTCGCADPCDALECCLLEYGDDPCCQTEATCEFCLLGRSAAPQPQAHKPTGTPAPQPAANGTAPTKPKRTWKLTPAKSRQWKKVSEGDFSDIYVELTIVGNAQWSGQPTPSRTGSKKGGPKAMLKAAENARKRQNPQTISGTTDENGTFAPSLVVTGPGAIFVVVSYIQYGAPKFPSILAINTAADEVASVPVAKLALLPRKAHRHVHDSIQLTAIAQDASNSPVTGAVVAFKVYGDCEPTADVTSATTGAGGIAHVTVVCSRPGEAWVVAAGVDAAGAPVLSEPAFIFFKPGGYDYYPGEGHEGYYHDHGYGYDHGYDRDDRYHHPY